MSSLSGLHKGITLSEMLITLGIISLLATLGIPSMQNWLAQIRLKGAVESSYFILQQARTDAIRSRTAIAVSFAQGEDWCIGLSQEVQCDCRKLNDCLLDGIERVWHASTFPGVMMSNVSFGSNSSTQFEPLRGLSSGHAGSLSFSTQRSTAKLILSNMGRARICVITGTVGRYPTC